jgi:hypothetical protein
MKKVLPFLLLILVMATVLWSCKKNKEISLDKWFFEKGLYEQYDPSGKLLSTQTDLEWTASDYFSLYEDGNFELVQNNQQLVGSYVIKDSILTLTYLQRSTTGTVSTSLNAAILEKSASKFTFRVDETVDTITYRSTLYLKK